MLASDSQMAGSSRINEARLAGLAYLVIILCGVWAEGVARPGLIIAGDAVETSAAVLGSLVMFRASLVADTVMALADVTLAVLLFRLLWNAGPGLALAALAFRLVQATLIGASLIALALVPDLAEAGQADLALMMTALHGTGYDIGLIFFGVNCLLMAVLLRRSGGVPGAIAYGIGAAGLVYLAGSYLRLIAPDLYPAFEPAYAVPLLAESAFCLWLLIRGRV